MSHTTILIGFGYKARRGKDSCAQAILDARSGQYDIRRYAFADALRQEVHGFMRRNWLDHSGGVPTSLVDPRAVALAACDELGIPFDHTAQIEFGYPFTKQRALFQWWGSEHRRSKDAFYWVNQLRAKIAEDNPQIALITDMRFRNEMAFVKSMEGYTVRVDRSGYEEKLTASQTSHPSETELDAVPIESWSHLLIGQEGQVEQLKQDAVNYFDKIVADLSFPLLDQMLSAA